MKKHSAARTIIWLAVALLLAFGLVAAGVAVTRETFTLYVDGQPMQIVGDYATVADVLAAAEVSVHSADIVIPDPATAADPAQAIKVKRAKAVLIRTDAGSETAYTHQTSLGAFLNEANIRPRRADLLYADERLVAFNAVDQTALPQVLEIGRFNTITINDGGQSQILRTTAQTVGEALQEANVTLYAADGITPPAGTWIAPNLVVNVRRSMPLQLLVDGQRLETRSYHTNALDVLAEVGIGLVGYDYVRPAADVTLQPNDTIEVIRVTEDFQLIDETIPFETVWQGTDQFELDQSGLLIAGEPGIKRQRVRVRYENGVEVSRTLDGEWLAREAVTEVMGFGTNIVVRTLETPNGPVEYWRQVRMRVTSYTAASSGKAPDHPRYGITRSGVPAGKGVVAVDPVVVPFRSQVYVPGYGEAFAGDTGGGVKGRWIDLGFDEDNYESWSGYVDVYYLTPIPDSADINYRIPTWLP